MNEYYKLIYVSFILLLALPLLIKMKFPTPSSYVFATIIKNTKFNGKHIGNIPVLKNTYSTQLEFLYFFIGFIIFSIVILLAIYNEESKRGKVILSRILISVIIILGLITWINFKSFEYKYLKFNLFLFTTIILALIASTSYLIISIYIFLYIYIKKEKISEFTIIMFISLLLIAVSRFIGIKFVYDLIYSNGSSVFWGILSHDIYALGIAIGVASFIYVIIDYIRRK